MGVFCRIAEAGLVWQESKVRMLARQVLAKQRKNFKEKQRTSPKSVRHFSLWANWLRNLNVRLLHIKLPKARLSLGSK